MNENFKIGHYTDTKNKTGCTVILCPSETVASCYIAGSSPGSRELALLSPERKIQHIHAIFLTGGSAFGLNAAAGVVDYLEEINTGYVTPHAVIPLVPAAVIYDLNYGSNKMRPVPENAYDACKNATENFSKTGSVGAGSGATVGKWTGLQNSMTGGIGFSEITFDNIWVKAVCVVNAVGDIIDDTGQIIAGAVDENNQFIAKKNQHIRWKPAHDGFGQNTVLSVIMTNGKISKMQAFLVAKRAQNGLARSILPANTSYDGDVIFTLARGESIIDFDLLCEMSAEALRQSIIKSVEKSIPVKMHENNKK